MPSLPSVRGALQRLHSFGSFASLGSFFSSGSRSPSNPGSKRVSRQASRTQVAPFPDNEADIPMKRRLSEASVESLSGFRAETAEREVLMKEIEQLKVELASLRGTAPARPASPAAVDTGATGLEASLAALPLLIAMAIFEAKGVDESDAAFVRDLTKQRVQEAVDASVVVRGGVWAAVERHQRCVAAGDPSKAQASDEGQVPA